MSAATPLARAVNIRREECDTYIGRPRKRDLPHNAPAEIRQLRQAVLDGTACLGDLDRLTQLVGEWGNPWQTGEVPDPIANYRQYLRYRLDNMHIPMRRITDRLAGKRLGCFCKPKACHGDLLAALANDGPAAIAG